MSGPMAWRSVWFCSYTTPHPRCYARSDTFVTPSSYFQTSGVLNRLQNTSQIIRSDMPLLLMCMGDRGSDERIRTCHVA
ncbi:hypothetical protein I7I48_08230 [Histoplasma ohiense]|nr:hypothetical protein I7I48_08230 [Histoplasma ohiense (nom. inval.)]